MHFGFHFKSLIIYQYLWNSTFHAFSFPRYVERLVVRDFETSECWFYHVHTWLSDYHMGECQIDVTVDAASMRELHTFRNLFTVKFGNYLKDRYVHCITINVLYIAQYCALQTYLVFFICDASLVRTWYESQTTSGLLYTSCFLDGTDIYDVLWTT